MDVEYSGARMNEIKPSRRKMIQSRDVVNEIYDAAARVTGHMA